MRKVLFFSLSLLFLYSCFPGKKADRKEREEKDKYDNPMARHELEAEKIKDPALGFVPYDRLNAAMQHTEELKNNLAGRTWLPLTWEERGPIYDSVGPSNGNGRGGGAGSTAGGYTSGRIRAFLLDTLNDPTGNTAITGGVAGGVWRCTDFLSTAPTWVSVSDNFANLAIGSIAQDPSNPLTIYVATGEATSNADAVYGRGVYKSTDGGLTFQFLPATASFLRNYKIGCDAAGNVYLACRITTVPVAQSKGLFRSTDGGASWTDITPTDLIAANNTCTDFEITSSGMLNATFGYLAANNVVNQRYTAAPATVTPASWQTGTGFRVTPGAIRTEMAVSGDVLYAITVNTAYNTDSCYKSVDGGITWVKQNTTVLPSGLGSGQGWYNLAMAINPSNTNELIAGGLDAYRSVNGGANWTRFTYWVSTSPYVHADHHFHQYWLKDGETRLIMATDGGLFYSANNGTTFRDKNKNLGIKQFYAGAIHPTAGSPYLLAGAQDNGTHQLKNPGLSYSIEVTGGDGCFVHINQVNPNIQFGSYVYNQYRRTLNGGNTWSSVNLSSSQGLFVNPFDHDDNLNIMYASNGPLSQMRRWINTNTATTNSLIGFSTANLGSATISLTAFKVSPFTANRLFFGTNNGRMFKLENANTVTTATSDANLTNIGSASFPAGYVSCVNTGTDDNNLIAVFSNYGVNNVWVTTDGGTTWSAIDGDLPDMPVRWAMFEPGDNSKIYLATEAGVYTTKNVSGASTNWLPEPGFPLVRTDMLKMRNSDSTIVAATHGRGLFTAKIPPCVTSSISLQPASTAVCPGGTAVFTVAGAGPSFLYQWQVSTDGGATWTDISGANNATYSVTGVTPAQQGNRYRCILDTYCSGLLTSNAATLTVNSAPVITNCVPAIVVSNTVGQCGATVNYPAPVVTGLPAPVISYSIPNGSVFPVGTTTVTMTATNSCGTQTCTFTVKVNDTQAPTVTCPSNITVTSPAGSCTAVVNYTVTANDNCPGATVTRTAGLASGAAFPLGTTTVTHFATDAAGNVSSSCSFTVTVLDGQLPVISTQPANAVACVGTNASFSVTASNVVSYQWQVWNGSAWSNIAGATASSYSVNSVTSAINTYSYRVQLNGLCTPVTSGFGTLTVNPLPQVTLSGSRSASLLPGENLAISSTVNPDGGTYAWYYNNGLLNNSTGSSLTGITVDNAGTYKLVYTDRNGCVNSSADFTVTRQPYGRFYVYPNPNNGIFQIRFYNSQNEQVTVRMFDSKGAKIYEKQSGTSFPYSSIVIDLTTTLSEGVYMVELIDSKGVRKGVQPVVIQMRR